MQVSQTVAVSAECFYGFLLKSLWDDYLSSGKAPTSKSELKKGLTFQKKFGKNKSNTAEIRVIDLIDKERYALSFQSSRGTQWMTYQIFSKDDRTCQVTYSEEFSPKGRLNRWNYKLLLPLMRKTMERRMVLQIEKIAEFAKNTEDLQHE